MFVQIAEEGVSTYINNNGLDWIEPYVKRNYRLVKGFKTKEKAQRALEYYAKKPIILTKDNTWTINVIKMSHVLDFRLDLEIHPHRFMFAMGAMHQFTIVDITSEEV